MRLQTKISIVLVTVALSLSLIAVSMIAYQSISRMKGEALLQNQRDLTAKKQLVRSSIEDYFDKIKSQIVTMAHDVSIREAARDFAQAFQLRPVDLSTQSGLSGYYSNEFQQVYSEQNKDNINALDLYNPLGDITRSMQAAFISDNPHPLGEKDALIALNDGSDYDRLHQRYHPTIRKLLQEFGYYDIFIVEPDNGYIVYSVFKELDYATSLKNGPYRNSGIAEAFNKGLSLQQGEVYLSDFAAYLPSYNNPASFISSPIYEAGELIGVLIYQMPIERINNIMTQSGKWREAGFGASGEIYLVGQDNTLRNESRFFVEDKSNYLQVIKSVGIQAHSLIEQKDTTIALQPVNTSGVKQALAGNDDFAIFDDYRKVPVLSAYGPVNVLNQRWAIMSEIDEAEAFEAIDGVIGQIISITITIMVVGTAAVFAVAMLFSKQLIAPLETLAERFQDLSQGEADLTLRVESANVPEIDAISHSFNTFVEQLQLIVGKMKDAVLTTASSATELSVTTEQTLSSMQQQRSEVSEVKESMSQFKTSVEEITSQTQASFDVTHKARQSAEENADRADIATGNIRQLVNEVTTSAATIEQLQNSVKDIGDVLGVITSIADQTNLLALNAAIEAARAGDQGRGFAVVADEVRQLAQRTQESTITIQEQIEGLTKSARESVDSMERASVSAEGGIHLVEMVKETLGDLKEVVLELADMNESISNSSQMQLHSIEFINENVANLEVRSAEVTESTYSITQVSNQLSQVAEEVKADVERFKV